MRERYIFDQNVPPVIELETNTELGVLALDHDNAELRLFGAGHEFMDHVLYYDEDGQPVGILLSQFTDPETKEKLLIAGHDYSFDKTPYPEDIEWYDQAFLASFGITHDEEAPETEDYANDNSETDIFGTAVSCALTGAKIVFHLGSMIVKKI